MARPKKQTAPVTSVQAPQSTQAPEAVQVPTATVAPASAPETPDTATVRNNSSADYHMMAHVVPAKGEAEVPYDVLLSLVDRPHVKGMFDAGILVLGQ